MSDRKVLKERRQKRLIVTPIIIRALYKNISGNEASLKYIQLGHENGVLAKSDLSLTYGEIVPASFLQILGYVASSLDSSAVYPTTRVFYDLGCGTGRAVICAALSPFPFSKVVGIEIIPELCDSAVDLKTCLQAAVATSCDELSKKTAGILSAVSPIPKVKKISVTLDENQLIEKIREIVSKNSEYGFCTQEFVCNELTKQLGHKLYRASLQPFGKFSKFMDRISSYFDVAEDGLLTIASPALIVRSDHSAVDLSTLENNNTLVGAAVFDAMVTNIAEISIDHDRMIDVLCNSENSKTTVHVEINTTELNGERTNAIKSILTSSPSILEAVTPLPEIDYILGSIFDQNWYEDADVAYAASLLFTEDMMQKLTEQAVKMKKNSWIISLKPLILTTTESLDKIVLREKSFHKMSWQMAEVFIYQIIT